MRTRNPAERLASFRSDWHNDVSAYVGRDEAAERARGRAELRRALDARIVKGAA